MEDFIKNDENALKYQITIMTLLCLLLLIIPVLIIVLALKAAAFAVLLYIISAIFFIVIIGVTVVNAIVSYKIYQYKIDKNGVEIIKGFIFKKHIYLPKNKITSIKIVSKRFIFKDLCNIIFENDAYDVIIKNITLLKADKLLKENFEGIYFNEGI